MRFYPDSILPFEHEPSRLDFAIRYIDSRSGEGVVSLRAFEPGDIAFRFNGVLTNEITQHSLQINANLHIHDPYFMGKILHHCNPNCDVDIKNRLFIVNRPIRPGDIVTMDYDSTEEILYKPFQCDCGAKNCRGFVCGSKEQQKAM